MEMESVLDIEVSAFSSYKGVTPKNVNLLIWLKSIKYLQKVNIIRKTDDIELRKRLKSELPAITPSGIFKSRKASELISHSGFLQFDIDFKDNLHISNYDELKLQIRNLKEIAYCGLSVSGNGYWGLVKISDVENHKKHFEALYLIFKKFGINIDKSCKDICRLRGYSIDHDAYFNHNASVFEMKTEKPIKVIPLKKGLISNNSENVNTQSRVIDILKVIQERQIDITDKYENWFAIGCSFANEFGENGREYFHLVSYCSPKYNYIKTDDQFNRCLKNRYSYSIGTFFYLCKLYNI